MFDFNCGKNVTLHVNINVSRVKKFEFSENLANAKCIIHKVSLQQDFVLSKNQSD